MNYEAAVSREVETCLSHHRIYVIPRDVRGVEKVEYSTWALCDPKVYAGIVWRQNTGGGRFGSRFVKFGVPGQQDYSGWLFSTGVMIALEVKAHDGRLSPDQKARHTLALNTGVHSAIVRSYQDCAEFCRQIGLKSPGEMQ